MGQQLNNKMGELTQIKITKSRKTAHRNEGNIQAAEINNIEY